MTNEPVIMLRWALGEAGLPGILDQAPQRAVRLRMDSTAAAALANLLEADPRTLAADLRTIHRIRVRTIEETSGAITVVLADAQGLRLAELITSRAANAAS
ncbi:MULTISPECIES: hypothetical protein [unclassified Streptomyces]|uniref:hypothetical protein n=1 Tax=unclassified Streptomyces TaxID=2593676 RepID=UPI0038004F06